MNWTMFAIIVVTATGVALLLLLLGFTLFSLHNSCSVPGRC
jgi:hypothetical protein